MESNSYPIEAPEFIRATTSAENASDVSLLFSLIFFVK